jgi:hypothetical protein
MTRRRSPRKSKPAAKPPVLTFERGVALLGALAPIIVALIQARKPRTP